MSTELKGRSPAGSWHNVQVTPNGELVVTGPTGAATDISIQTLITSVDALATASEVQPTSNIGSIIKVAWNDFQVITKNAAGNPTLITYFNGVTQVAQVTITYDVDGDLQRLQVT